MKMLNAKGTTTVEQVIEATKYEDQPVQVESREITNPLFKSYMMNADGITRAQMIAQCFDDLFLALQAICLGGREGNREWSITQTKLEEAAFYAKKSMAQFQWNQLNTEMKWGDSNVKWPASETTESSSVMSPVAIAGEEKVNVG